MMMKCQFHWGRKPEHPEETTNLHQPRGEDGIPCAGTDIVGYRSQEMFDCASIDLLSLQCRRQHGKY